MGLRYTSIYVREPINVVDVFRPSNEVFSVAEEALKVRPKVFWMQEGIYDPIATNTLKKRGIVVVWNRCIMKEHNRLFGSKPYVPIGKLGER